MGLKLNFWPGTKSTEDSTGVKRSDSKMAPLQSCWQDAAICHQLFGKSSQILTMYSIHSTVISLVILIF